MASVVKICNMALSHIGADARVSSIDPPDGSVEAGLCADFYDLARTELIEPGNWRFALHRAELAEVTNISTTRPYAYALPSDCLRPLRVLGQGAFALVFNPDHSAALVDDRGSVPFDIEGSTLYTNEVDAVLVYVRDVTDTTKFTPSFTSALSYLLAAYLAGPILKGSDGMRTGDAMRERASRVADMAATASANASHDETTLQSSITAVRA